MRLGIVGFGGMGASHAKYIVEGKVPGVELTAICDPRPERQKFATEEVDKNIKPFADVDEMLGAGAVDGVLIATPHFAHPEVAIKAFDKGLHVLTEKPAGSYTKQVREMNEAAKKSGKVFGIMFNQRTNPAFQKVKEMMENGELGDMLRCTWIITSWFRSQAYYDSGDWRGTWSGEGGGVLMNQCPHNLDLWQWMCGMPTRVRAFCGFGKHHDIEVEDDVTAYVEYENGATGLFVAGTGESPGTNRLEISADNGKLVLEDGKLTFWKNSVPVREFCRATEERFKKPQQTKIDVEVDGTGEGGHAGITRDWISAIENGTPLLAPGLEGINSLELANAMVLSEWLDEPVDLPIDDDLYYEKLQEKMK
jgi:predicted dehydrogenase